MGLTFQELREITNDFSEERKVGRGPYGAVYKGINKDGERIAVMLLDAFLPGLDNDLLQNEIHKLSMLKHPNLVQYISYCYENQHIEEEGNGRTSPVENTYRALCFEYLRNGSIERHLSDEFSGLDWHTRHKILQGICKGLAYIHLGLEEHIYHFNLKPDSIFLDQNMEPKLAYWGLSMIIGSNLATTVGDNYRTRKYCPPEYKSGNTLSKEFDVFSLGVIMIEIISGPSGYMKKADMTSDEFHDLVLCNWISRLHATWQDSPLYLYANQVAHCIEIALDCVDNDMHKRPNIVDIVRRLNDTKYTAPINEGTVARNLWEPPIGKDSISRRDNIYVEFNLLERIIEGKEKPSKLQLPLLQHITKNFSDERTIGWGGCGVVYKGILGRRTVAVKKLFNSYTIEDRMFHQEVKTLMMIDHPNIVRFLGYCSHTEEKATEIMEGKFIMAQIRERLLCFEYITKGSLENQLTDELRGLEWHMRFQIIKGICEGMHHLHKEKHIIHMDLKPSNILLDDQMVPKITDFGLSRFDEKSKTTSAERILSLGYCAPEYINDGEMSAKSDIYSLGVIITELVTGSKAKPSINKVLRRWKHRWNKSVKDTKFEYKQVAKCLDLALRCKHTDPRDRPNIEYILSGLNEMDSSVAQINDTTECLELEDMLGIEPLDMHLTFELQKQISCSVELTNDTDDYFAFRITTTSLRPYDIQPSKGIVPPRSKCCVTITLGALENAPRPNQCRDEFSVQSTRVDGSLTATDIDGDLFSEHSCKVVDDVTLVVVLGAPELSGDW